MLPVCELLPALVLDPIFSVRVSEVSVTPWDVTVPVFAPVEVA